MNFGEELRKLSSEAKSKEVTGTEEVWKAMKEALRGFAAKTGERGCNVFFDGVSRRAIEELERLADEDNCEFINWNSPKEQGHPGGDVEQIGIIFWDRSWYLSKYPFKVSLFSMIVSVKKDTVQAEIIDSEAKTISLYNNKKKKS